MKRLPGLILAFTILFTLTACAAGEVPSDKETGGNIVQTAASSEATPPEEIGKMDFASGTVLLNSGYTTGGYFRDHEALSEPVQ